MEADPDSVEFDAFIPKLAGLPSGVGYFREPDCDDPFLQQWGMDDSQADDADGAARLIRKLTLRTVEMVPGRALRFTERDLATLLKGIIRATGDPSSAALITSCDSTVLRDGPIVDITLTLDCAEKSPGSDRRLAKGIIAVFNPDYRFTTAAGVVLTAVDYAGGSLLKGAMLCRVITRSSHDSVRAAFIARGVPAEDILQVTAKPVGDTGVPSNTVYIRLTPGYPIQRVPWKVPLQEPDECLGPRKVAIQGHQGCNICRDPSHSKSSCQAYREDLCGRCTIPLAALRQQGRNPLNHDCEGGPGGYGAANLDPLGEGWHLIWKQFELARLQNTTESVDPVTSRASDLQAAKDLADIVRAQLHLGKKKKKKGKRDQPCTPVAVDENTPQAAVRPRQEPDIPALSIGQ